MLTIGVCDDHDTIRSALARGIRRGGHEVVTAHDGREALARFGPATRLDAIVMDIGLPDADGRDVVQALKSGGQHAPVVFLTALGATHEKLSGFAAGGADYIVKPFDIREVLARLEAVTARAPVDSDPSGLRLDPLAHVARTDSGEVRLTPTEFRILAAILARPGQVVRRRAVVAAAWPDGAQVSDNTVDSFLRRIRAKLQTIESTTTVETVRGVGYRVS